MCLLYTLYNILNLTSPLAIVSVMYSNFCRYDFHRGVDIPTPEGTHVYAIDDGMVRRAGRHQGYTDPLVQVFVINFCTLLRFIWSA